MHSETRSFYQFIAVLLHPIIYPLLTAIFYMYFTPRYFNTNLQIYVLAIILIGTLIFPLIFLTILKYSNLISGFLLKDPQERKYPYAIFTILALMLSRIFFKIELTYELGVYFIAGGITFIIGYWFLYFEKKISLHTMGIGSFIGFVVEMSWLYQINFLNFLAILFIILGITAHNRIQLKSHSFNEVILGFIIGFLPQIFIPLIYQNM